MIDVLAAVIVKDQKVFLAKRNTQGSQGGLWEFPGGKLEEGETPCECLKRELQEELSVDATIGEYITENRHRYPEKTICLIAYFAAINEEPRLKEHEEFRWVDYDKLLNYNLAPADRPIAKAVIEVMAREI